MFSKSRVFTGDLYVEIIKTSYKENLTSPQGCLSLQSAQFDIYSTFPLEFELCRLDEAIEANTLETVLVLVVLHFKPQKNYHTQLFGLSIIVDELNFSSLVQLALTDKRTENNFKCSEFLNIQFVAKYF